ncbi:MULTISPECIES: hypothetical protein [unclassified Mycolicibacterium]|uniref:hypothetical protein n=1 Tax=unclassified Mycolicibacterium TaxID=2636767 RepID=UPI0012DE7450|nr:MULTISPECIES: hypothetical protein [unclassified Mycolicibacterium]
MALAVWLGHADVSFNKRTYGHAQAGARELAVRSFAACTPTAPALLLLQSG